MREGSQLEGGRRVDNVTHDESTFNVNDGRRQMWLQDGENPLRPKGNGKGIMISEFLTPRSHLQAPPSILDDQLEEQSLRRFATEIFEYGGDKYWNSEMLARQTLKVAVPLFGIAFPPDQFQGLFLFDNATSHNVMAPDALDTRKMNLGSGGKQPVMRDGWNSRTNTSQAMNDDDGKTKSYSNYSSRTKFMFSWRYATGMYEEIKKKKKKKKKTRWQLLRSSSLGSSAGFCKSTRVFARRNRETWTPGGLLP